MKLIDKIFGDPNAREIERLGAYVDKINALEPDLKKLSDEKLKGKTDEFKKRLEKGETLDDILAEAFATVREAARRTIGKRHYDVQLITGVVLHKGRIAEMKTGEGKTLAATLPLYLNALTGKGAHLVTVNDYLARLHAAWMGKVYHALGMTTSCIQQQGKSYVFSPDKGVATDGKRDEQHVSVDDDELREVTRKEAYACDITYGTNNEFGFDYLRDNMSQTLEEQVQRGLVYAIVDEVDSILIDEARTPLIISGPAQEATQMYHTFAKLIPTLSEGVDYNIDEKMRAATLTEEGIKKVEKALGVDNLYAEGGIRQVHHLEQALKAHALFKIDKDYVVRDGELIIVDEFTGRLMYGRRFSDGLHQALEAKEGLNVQQESVTMASITFQNYFRMYEKLSGMTGTAKTEEEEFAKIYGLSVLVIPTNKPIARIDKPDVIYKNEIGKFKAVIEEVKRRNEIGQPVLIGTVSIEKNEQLSSMLKSAGVKHELLNAKNHEREAEIIAQAGRVGAVTVATNMAGRGVDILLGGSPFDEELYETVKKLGGLHVIGTERHESRRIDNQLRGRAGRQGDPGSSQFYISTEDDLMRIFGSDRMKSVMERLGVPDDMPIEHKLISKSIESAQKKVEGHNFDMRKHIVQYDDVINKHRSTIYRQRQNILLSAGGKQTDDNLTNEDRIMDMIEREIRDVVTFHTQSDNEETWDIDEVYEVVDTILPLPISIRLDLQDMYEEVEKSGKKLKGREAVVEHLVNYVKTQYQELKKSFVYSKSDKDKDLSGSITESVIQKHVSGDGVSDSVGAKTSKDSERSDEAEDKTLGESEEEGVKDVEKVETPPEFVAIETAVLLRSIDTLWVEHLDAMDHLRQGIGLRGYGQRDPLVEYKREAYQMFNMLQDNIRKQVVYSIFKVAGIRSFPQREEEQKQLVFSGAQKTLEKGSGQFGSNVSGTLPSNFGAQANTAPAKSSAVEKMSNKVEGVKESPVEKSDKVGRNDPCPCGSGKKYKKCHGK